MYEATRSNLTWAKEYHCAIKFYAHTFLSSYIPYAYCVLSTMKGLRMHALTSQEKSINSVQLKGFVVTSEDNYQILKVISLGKSGPSTLLKFIDTLYNIVW